MRRNKGNKKAQVLITILFLIIGAFGYLFGGDFLESSNSSGNGKEVNGKAEIHYLDVGQGDSIYLKINDKDILIDAGPKSDSDKLIAQLKNLGIDDLEMVIATHPHEDHIGGMVSVFKEYKVKSFYMTDKAHTTKTFTNMLEAVKKQGLKHNILKSGEVIDLGDGAKFDVFSPINKDYEELNDYSPIMKLTYGNSTFMFTGDAEVLSEKEVLNKFKASDLKSDVLKVGHHGSTTSTSDEFLKAVNPKFAIISLGKDNSYGHPHKEIVNKLDSNKIKTYRTDISGQITIITDGQNINISTAK
ncbi:MAG: MBL fold metallo-hydrolase [Clostridium sp.]|nr:MBL fold metallo-hydrolase [Clostridium sp.]